MSALRRICRARRGAALVEFAFASLMVITILLTTFEFGVDLAIRQSSERAVTVAMRTYGETRDRDAANDAAMSQMPPVFERCLKPLTIRLFNNTTDLGGGGRNAAGTAADLPADLATLRLECEWERLTPLARGLFGPRLNYNTQATVRLD